MLSIPIINKLGIYWLSLCIVIPICGMAQSKNESYIKGRLHLDSIWEPVAYLSYIPTFKDMNTMSNDMIIAEAKIDSIGDFIFDTNNLPKEDNLYRLHLSKKDAPMATLIIGGNEENHVFLVASNSSSIHLRAEKSNGLFTDYSVEGYRPNKDIKFIRNLLYEHENNSDSLALRKEFREKSLQENLRKLADTSSNAIVSLYALHSSKFETTFLEHQEFYQAYLKKWNKNKSTYFKELRLKFPPETKSSNLLFILLGLVLFALGFVLNYVFNSRKKRKVKSFEELSVQERKIFELIQAGKSNKEISLEHNIGISTVKSHVSNIYSKLNIKSRKEAMNL